jgi:hypothetical protein
MVCRYSDRAAHLGKLQDLAANQQLELESFFFSKVDKATKRMWINIL